MALRTELVMTGKKLLFFIEGTPTPIKKYRTRFVFTCVIYFEIIANLKFFKKKQILKFF